jgi:aryl-alcohol dehydrogenase-like predicted oxidoreductase
MTRRPRKTPGRKTATDPTRRQFLSTLVIGAAYTACGDPAHDLAGSGASGGPGEPHPRVDASTESNPRLDASATDARSGMGTPADTGTSADATASPQPDAGSPVATPTNKSASDRVMLGATGIMVSRLAMGSGTHGSNGTSAQTELGVDAFARLLVESYHEKGITFWETADQYGSHPHLKEAIRQVGRQNLVILTKSAAQTAKQMQADLDRYLLELGTDHIDILLLHAVDSGTWTEQCAGAMEYLEGAKQRGIIRAHGTSCHSLPALRLAARTPWVDVDLARINPASILMDSDPATVIGVLREMKAAGKGVVGMKILGVGKLANQMDTAIRHAVELDAIDAFTIGFTSYSQLDEVTTKIAQFPV